MSDRRAPSAPAAPPTEAQQRDITRLCVQTGMVLMQHGAESALIETLIRRLGLALGVDRVEAGVFANSIVLSTLVDARSMTTVRRSQDRGINMHAVTEVQRAVLQVEEGALDLAGYEARLDGIAPFHYRRWLVSVAIGLSCAAFARLAGADAPSCAVVFGASGLAMFLRVRIARLHFSPVVNFFVSAFVATSLAGLGEVFGWGLTHNLARASCVLFLVPGFPLINGVSDMVKGYMSTGIARLANATILASAAATGILLAMALWNMWGGLGGAGAGARAEPAAVRLLLELVQTAFLAAIPAVGFGMAFNVPKRILPWCALGGALGRTLRLGLVESGVQTAWATFLAATAVSWLGVWAAQRLRAHPKVFTVAAVIPMVPGVPMYRTLLALSQMQRNGVTNDLLSTALSEGLNTSFIVAALAVGLAVPGLFVYRRRPVV